MEDMLNLVIEHRRYIYKWSQIEKGTGCCTRCELHDYCDSEYTEDKIIRQLCSLIDDGGFCDTKKYSYIWKECI